MSGREWYVIRIERTVVESEPMTYDEAEDAKARLEAVFSERPAEYALIHASAVGKVKTR